MCETPKTTAPMNVSRFITSVTSAMISYVSSFLNGVVVFFTKSHKIGVLRKNYEQFSENFSHQWSQPNDDLIDLLKYWNLTPGLRNYFAVLARPSAVMILII